MPLPRGWTPALRRIHEDLKVELTRSMWRVRTECDADEAIGTAVWFWWKYAGEIEDEELGERLAELLGIRGHEAPFEIKCGGIVTVTPEAYWNPEGLRRARAFMFRARRLAEIWMETAWLRQA